MNKITLNKIIHMNKSLQQVQLELAFERAAGITTFLRAGFLNDHKNKLVRILLG